MLKHTKYKQDINNLKILTISLNRAFKSH